MYEIAAICSDCNQKRSCVNASQSSPHSSHLGIGERTRHDWQARGATFAFWLEMVDAPTFWILVSSTLTSVSVNAVPSKPRRNRIRRSRETHRITGSVGVRSSFREKR
jgi:hypothetical protein